MPVVLIFEKRVRSNFSFKRRISAIDTRRNSHKEGETKRPSAMPPSRHPNLSSISYVDMVTNCGWNRLPTKQLRYN